VVQHKIGAPLKMLQIEPNTICKINLNDSFYTFSKISENSLKIPKSLKTINSSNLGIKSLKVRALI